MSLFVVRRKYLIFFWMNFSSSVIANLLRSKCNIVYRISIKFPI
ncbi:hypothetical protein KSS87_022515 [Heliosperma pusillum]|nr:hypothetical protein KSS87_022515 [Heliosperma pusillum]